MERTTDRHLTRWLAGELGPEEERALRRRFEVEPELARRAEDLRRTWQLLGDAATVDGEAAGEGGVPPGFTRRVMARVREEGPPRAGLGSALGAPFGSGASAWARAAGAAALAVGVVLGAGLGVGLEGGPAPGLAPLEAPPDTAPLLAAAGGADGGRSESRQVPEATEAGGGDTAAGVGAGARDGGPGAEAPVRLAAGDDLAAEWLALYYGDEPGGDEARDLAVGAGNAEGGIASLGDRYAAALATPAEEGT